METDKSVEESLNDKRLDIKADFKLHTETSKVKVTGNN